MKLIRNNKELLVSFAKMLTISGLLFYTLWSNLIPIPAILVHSKFPPNAYHYTAYVLNCLLLAVILTIVNHQINQSKGLLKVVLELVVLLVVLMAFFAPFRDIIRVLLPEYCDRIFGFLKIIVLGIIGVYLTAIINSKIRQRFRLIVSQILLILLPFVLLTFIKAGYYAVISGSFVHPLPEPKPYNGTLQKPGHVYVLLFDELAQREIFDDRPADVQLPEIDRFVSEALTAENAICKTRSTTRVLSSIFTGRSVVKTIGYSPVDVKLKFTDNPDPLWLGKQETVFSRLEALGFRTGFQTWILPFGRFIGNQASYCDWVPSRALMASLSQREEETNVLRIMIVQFYDMLSSLPFAKPSDLFGYDRRDKAEHLYEFFLAYSKACKLLTKDFNFAFVHMPVPHSPYIYDSKENMVTFRATREHGFYENLELADMLLGLLRRHLEQEGLWDQSTVILTGDHCWRTPQDVGESLDLRVVFSIKLPNQQFGVSYQEETSNYVINDLTIDLLEQKIADYDQLAEWLESHPVE